MYSSSKTLLEGISPRRMRQNRQSFMTFPVVKKLRRTSDGQVRRSHCDKTLVLGANFAGQGDHAGRILRPDEIEGGTRDLGESGSVGGERADGIRFGNQEIFARLAEGRVQREGRRAVEG